MSRDNGWLSRCAVLAALLSLPLTHVSAAVVEITQAKALAGGVGPGDPPGFPVVINQSGSYRLGSNLFVGYPDQTAIEVRARDVTIDLDGFSIVGSTWCSGEPTSSCFPPGAGTGIDSDHPGLVVRNGTVRGMAKHGIAARSAARIEGVRVVTNGNDGIDVGPYSIITNSIAEANGGHGIWVREHTTINGCLAFNNRYAGIANYGDGIVINTISEGNGNLGISCGSIYFPGCVVENVIVRRNGRIDQTSGLGLSDHGIARGAMVTDNERHGISCGTRQPGCLVQQSTMAGNGGYQLFLVEKGGYGENVIIGPEGWTVFGGVQLGANSCNGKATCP